VRQRSARLEHLIVRPPPRPTTDSACYWDAVARGELVAQECGACGALRHPPRPMCPHCHSLEWNEHRLRGTGTIYSYAVLHHPQNVHFEYPVLAVLVDLDEGVRIVSNLVGVEPDAIRIGARVRAEFVATDAEGAVPVFRPIDVALKPETAES
jgi:uncharacterized OB-fold protein